MVRNVKNFGRGKKIEEKAHRKQLSRANYEKQKKITQGFFMDTSSHVFLALHFTFSFHSILRNPFSPFSFFLFASLSRVSYCSPFSSLSSFPPNLPTYLFPPPLLLYLLFLTLLVIISLTRLSLFSPLPQTRFWLTSRPRPPLTFKPSRVCPSSSIQHPHRWTSIRVSFRHQLLYGR